MTIEKLARAIVDEYFEGSPGSETTLIAVENEKKKLEDTMCTWGGLVYVRVQVEDKYNA